jgi:hypothetical protein
VYVAQRPRLIDQARALSYVHSTNRNHTHPILDGRLVPK